MSLVQSIVLGALQGLTEFLPISSAAHIVMAKAIMHIDTGNDVSFEVFARLGTMLSVIAVFIEPIRKMSSECAAAFRDPGALAIRYRDSEYFRLAVLVAAGCVPAGVIGAIFNNPIEGLFDDPKLLADMLIVTGAILFFTRIARPISESRVTFTKSIVIGFAQALAVIPGISRSATTIGSALLLGIPYERAAEFSFLMAVPVIFGATMMKARYFLVHTPTFQQTGAIAAGAVMASLAGYVALRLLLGVLKRGKFALFSYYCFAVGILGIVFVG